MSFLVKHFVINPKAIIALEEFDLNEEEKIKLTDAVILLYHQKLLTKFLEKLEKTDKELFLESFMNEPQEKAISFLRERITDIEAVVEEAIAEIEEQILNDFMELKGKT